MPHWQCTASIYSMKIRNAIIINAIMALLSVTQNAMAENRTTRNRAQADSSVLQRVASYGHSYEGTLDATHSNMYLRYSFKTLRRNPTLMAIPTMFYIAKGKREYAGEAYNRIFIRNGSIRQATTQASLSTIPHNRSAMEVLLKYLMPNIYGVTMVGNQLLSPLNSHNIRLYRYTITYLTGNRAEIVFRPRRYNTQLVSGSAIADRSTGRVIRVKFSGEFDMIDFHVDAVMGVAGIHSLMPKTCDINANFHFMGNRLAATYSSVFDNPITLPDSVKNSHDTVLMDELRPTPLPESMSRLYDSRFHADKDSTTADTVSTAKHRKRWDKALWDAVGGNIVKRIKGSFGSAGQGSYRISPILNPLSVSYSKRKGITYKTRVRAGYAFSENSNISLSFRGGYSLRQKQFYFKLPLRYTFNRRKNGYLEAEYGNGNRITNSSIVDKVKSERLDSMNWNQMNLKYFKDNHLKLILSYNISSRWNIQPGFIMHRREAVDRTSFQLAGQPASYYSFAPSLQLQYYPHRERGPVFTLDYERAIKGIGKADMEYERFEFDASWLKRLYSLRSLTFRFGGGFYTSKSKNSYFLDYANFREDNIPDGWNDDWAGRFLLLNSNWYNASEYYVRTNVTYESPLMLLSRIPYVGRMMEMERIYVNTLYAERLHPYVECGYGFTNRFFSMGVFVATSNRSFEGVGCRFDFELFRDW